jgi:hypothetical protein
MGIYRNELSYEIICDRNKKINLINYWSHFHQSGNFRFGSVRFVLSIQWDKSC